MMAYTIMNMRKLAVLIYSNRVHMLRAADAFSVQPAGQSGGNLCGLGMAANV